jgi:NAD(P)-dependent dehydrogenase (short-subunit alcohol dehydrogenase family)
LEGITSNALACGQCFYFNRSNLLIQFFSRSVPEQKFVSSWDMLAPRQESLIFLCPVTAWSLKNEWADMTEKIPLARAGTPEDVAGAALFLASRAGAYVNGIINYSRPFVLGA